MFRRDSHARRPPAFVGRRNGMRRTPAHILLALPAAFLMASCAPNTAPSATSPTDTPTVMASAQSPTAAPLVTGLSERKITVGELKRTYYLYVPKDFSVDEPVPVVMVFHGYGQEGSYMVPATGFDNLADANGFFVVYPNGTDPGGELSWNAGECCGYAHQNGIDESAFVRQILADLGSWAAVDPKRIYATGFSNGGILSYRLACDMSDTLAAVAPVSGTLFYDGCKPKQPVSVIHIHGSTDDTVPFAGGTAYDTDFPPVEKGITAWAGFDGCENPPQTEQAGMATHTMYSGCQNGTAVELYLLKDVGHRWPPEGVWPASRTIWEFFAAHPKPE